MLQVPERRRHSQGCWGGSQAASQKDAVFLTAACLQEITLLPSCTVSGGAVAVLASDSQSKPTTKGQTAKASHLSLLQDFAVLQSLASST